MDLNLRVFKEPRGMIRIIQQVMAIIAFASTSGFSNSSSFFVHCKNWEKKTEYTYSYPFKLSHHPLHVPKNCTDSATDLTFETKTFYFDFSSNAEFFVATGVLAFLYTLGILALYVFMDNMYTTNHLAPVVDLGITFVLTTFWLAGSSAWSSGVEDLKYYTNPENMFHRIGICKEAKDTCRVASLGNFASLNVSLIVGFANFLLWGSSMWFIYKETYFHQQRSQFPAQPPPPPGATAQYSVENQFAAPQPGSYPDQQDLGKPVGGGMTQYEY